MTTKEEIKFVIEVEHEEIIVQPVCDKDRNGWAEVFGKVVIDGKVYEFHKFIDLEFKEKNNESNN